MDIDVQTMLLNAFVKADFKDLIPFFLKIFVLYMFVNIVKVILSHIFNYFMIRIDTLGIGSTVEYEGIKAKIKSIGFSKIILDSKDKIIYVNIDDWRKIDLVIPKDKNNNCD